MLTVLVLLKYRFNTKIYYVCVFHDKGLIIGINEIVFKYCFL